MLFCLFLLCAPPLFVLGDLASTYVSGSEGNLEISSSRFIAARDGDVTIGNIGAEHAIVDDTGLTIKDGDTVRASLLNDAITLNGASTNDQVLINASGVQIKGGGSVRTTLASNVVTVGKAGEARTVISDTEIKMFDGAGTPAERVNLNSSGAATAIKPFKKNNKLLNIFLFISMNSKSSFPK